MLGVNGLLYNQINCFVVYKVVHVLEHVLPELSEDLKCSDHRAHKGCYSASCVTKYYLTTQCI